MTRRSPKPIRKRLRSLYNWHRWLGVISALFVIWLAVTGIALEHSHDLGLAKRPVVNPWLLRQFGVEVTAPATALQYEEHWLTHIDGRLYLNNKIIDQAPSAIGFCRLGLLWAVASRETLWLLNDKAEVLDKLEGLDLPGRISGLSPVPAGLLIETSRGNYVADPLSPNWPDWQASALELRPQHQERPLPEAWRQPLTALAESHALNWERVLVDAHSGRLFGRYGVWLMDAMAISFIILAITGLALWLRYRRATRKRRIKRRLQKP